MDDGRSLGDMLLCLLLALQSGLLNNRDFPLKLFLNSFFS